jgi:restriction endonuclease Mrr
MNGNADIFNSHYYSSYQKRETKVSDDVLDELEKQLTRQVSDRKELSPGRAEDLVAGVFSEHLNSKIHYTTNGVYTPDGGIDFVLVETNTGIEYAFQVKRRLTDKAERVQPIREFIGAVALQGYNHGYFVTFAPRLTKTIEKELEQGRESLSKKGMSIEVIDGKTLYDVIGHLRNAHLRGHPLLDGKSWGFESKQSEWHEVPLEVTESIVPKQLWADASVSLKQIVETA